MPSLPAIPVGTMASYYGKRKRLGEGENFLDMLPNEVIMYIMTALLPGVSVRTQCTRHLSRVLLASL